MVAIKTSHWTKRQNQQMLQQQPTLIFVCARLCWLVGVFFLTSMASSLADGHPVVWQGTVLLVIDGDSLQVDHAGQQVKIRLNGIDTPEYGQPWSKQAKEFTRQQAFGKKVTVIEKEKDRYGRTVATLLLPNGENLNQLLIGQGLAWWYRHFSKDQLLKALETQARKARIGLWSATNPKPPWAWRRTHKRPR